MGVIYLVEAAGLRACCDWHARSGRLELNDGRHHIELSRGSLVESVESLNG